jgi:hypothetical protein
MPPGQATRWRAIGLSSRIGLDGRRAGGAACWRVDMHDLKEAYPYYLANAAVFDNRDLEVTDKFSGAVATLLRDGGCGCHRCRYRGRSRRAGGHGCDGRV